jgi:hypothetical protein
MMYLGMLVEVWFSKVIASIYLSWRLLCGDSQRAVLLIATADNEALKLFFIATVLETQANPKSRITV